MPCSEEIVLPIEAEEVANYWVAVKGSELSAPKSCYVCDLRLRIESRPKITTISSANRAHELLH